VEINRSGAAPLAELEAMRALRPGQVMEKQAGGAVVLDTRPAAQFGSAHIPGSIQIGLSGQYASWAGILLGLETELVLVAEDDEKLEESRMRLARVGIERVAGYLADGIAGWAREGLPLEEVAQMPVNQLHAMLEEDPAHVQVIDVRRPAEWQEGHVPGAVLKPLNKLTAMLEGIDSTRAIAAYCKGGYRSSIATSLLQRAGFQQVINVTGGFDGWRACGLPCVTPGRVSVAAGI
jgi:hydroxyacylglutathione hydrolase